MSNTKRLCTFMVDDLYIGVDVCSVQEVLRHDEITMVPLAAPEIGGLINLRGQILTAIDLRKRLQLGPRNTEGAMMNIIVKVDDEAISLLVDRICDVLTVESESFEDPPDTLAAGIREVIQGVYKRKDKLLFVLRTDRVMPPPMEAAA